MRPGRQAVNAIVASAMLILATTRCVSDFIGGPGAGHPGTPGGPGPANETLVIIAGGTDTLAALGQEHAFVAELRDGNGVLIRDHPMTWSIDATSVAFIDLTGTATAVGNGIATVRVTADGLTATTTLTVWQAVDSIAINPGSFKLNMFDSRRLAATALDPLGHPVTRPVSFQWKSGNSLRVDVESDDPAGTTATATRTSRGTTPVIASTEGKSGSATAR